MDAQAKVDQAVAKQRRAGTGLVVAVKEAVPQIQRRLPNFMQSEGTASRLAAIALDTVMGSASLRECTAASIVKGIITAAEYGLALDGVMGHAYLVPYNIKGIKTAQFQTGYRGLVELMYRTGFWQSIKACVVRGDDDIFDFREGTTPYIDHKAKLDSDQVMVATYAIAFPKEGSIPTFALLGEKAVLKHRDSSKAFARNPKDSIWTTHPEWAWKKSAVRELSKTVAMATDKHDVVRAAAVLDERIDEGVMVIDAEGEVIDGPPEPGSEG